MQEWPGSLLGASGAGKSTTLNILGAMENNDKVALAVAFSTTLGGIMAIVKLAMGLWTMSVLFIVSAVYYAMLCVSRFSIVKSHTPYAPDCRPRAATHSGDECLPPYRWAPVLHRPVDAAAAALDGAGVGRRSPDDAVPAVEITAETEA